MPGGVSFNQSFLRTVSQHWQVLLGTSPTVIKLPYEEGKLISDAICFYQSKCCENLRKSMQEFPFFPVMNAELGSREKNRKGLF